MAKTTKRKPKRSVQDKLKLAQEHVSDVGEDLELLKILVYGKNGKGKTHFGATGPKPIIIDCNEKGTSSARKMKAKKFRVDTWEDIDLAYWYLKSGKHDRETVVIDTITSLATLCMKWVLGDEASRDPTQDPNLPDKRHWFKVTELMKTVILNFRNLDMNVVFLAQERRGYSEDDEEAPEVYPDISASARATLQASVTIIGWMHTKGVKVKYKDPKTKKTKTRVQTDYRMLLGQHDTYITKVNIQDHGLPDVMRDPSIQKILDIVNKKAKTKGTKSAKGKK